MQELVTKILFSRMVCFDYWRFGVSRMRSFQGSDKESGLICNIRWGTADLERPCKDFTPELVKLYECLQKRGEELKIIFVSFDHDMTLFYEHFWSSMPWLAVICNLKATIDSSGFKGVHAYNNFTMYMCTRELRRLGLLIRLLIGF
ncbi:uncharacterized protein LOC108834203 isoform X1 [Raphanus sativus]|uniref:Uncharacterized protein LOC108834203 isoform X1 n=1 Tax=Raphanus sativus TaxID=3726 RepID=A0A9W3CEQ6_RAPSA|nr:uncharacterized protein LOC108834203 isoform X1 [Raphanus sativus]